MRRREFIKLVVGGAAVAWPLMARAQQGERVRRVGVVMPGTTDDPEYQIRLAAFTERLSQLGWVDGQNIRIDTRWVGGDRDQRRKFAMELVTLAPDVILVPGSSSVEPLLQAMNGRVTGSSNFRNNLGQSGVCY